MAHTQIELIQLSECLKEILDEKYAPTVHELRKKVSVLTSKQQEFNSRIQQYNARLELFSACHTCHNLLVERRDRSTQTNEEDFIEEQTRKPSITKTPRDSNNISRDHLSNGVTAKSPAEQASSRPNEKKTTSRVPNLSWRPAVQPKVESRRSPDEPVAGPSGLNRASKSPSPELICIDSD